MPRAPALLALVFLSLAGRAEEGPGPFNFREAFLLELRIAHSGEELSAGNAQEWLSRVGPSPTLPFKADRGDQRIYATGRWVELLADTDRFRRMGGLDIAEKQYLDMLQRLRAAQGPSSDAVLALLDHIGEFYLEARNPDRAAELFAEAVAVARAGDARQFARRLRLGDILARLGQIDLARGNLAGAVKELAEANAIGDESPNARRCVNSLYATYFLSLALEAQGKTRDAEDLWRAAVKDRESVAQSLAYWDAMKEQAAFYARRGDFRQAAAIAARVAGGTAGKPLQPELPPPYPLDARPRIENPDQPQYSLYAAESEVAMAEILAVDKWRSDGPDAAAPLLKDPFLPFRFWMDHGADSERAALYRWAAKRVYIHASILLDGVPSDERVGAAYALVSQIKGRYLASNRTVVQSVEADRGDASGQNPEVAMLDRLADARARQAHLFIATALDGNPFDAAAFVAGENRERVLTEALSARTRGGTVFSLSALERALPADAALVDTIVWERSARDGRASREYGAFVVRAGQPVRYVRLGDAAELDADVMGLESRVVGDRPRGVTIVDAAGAPVADVPAALRKLHQKLMLPLAPLVGGAQKLYVVTDGKLALVPFGALVDAEGHSVLERQTVSYLDSWRDLYSSEVYGRGATSPPVVIGNPDFNAILPSAAPAAGRERRGRFEPLPEAGKEAAEVAKALAIAPDRALLGARAREDLLRAVVGPEVLHFATHSIPYLRWQAPVASFGLFELPRPWLVDDPFLQSAIALAGANRPQGGPEDGLLTGLEVASLHLSGTKLVVLSSCESAQGVPVDGQGVLGLRAAFATAGADAVVMSLWKVSDEAGREMMARFYTNLGAGPAEALRRAQLAMRADPKFSNPFYWAGYVVSGIPRAAATRAAPAATGGSLAAPVCAQMATRNDRHPMHTFWDTIRVRWSGAIARKSSAPDAAVYVLPPPGSAVEYRYSTVAPNGVALPDRLVRRAGDVTLTVRRDARRSSVLIQAGEPARFSIFLEGPPNLFPTLDLPEKLPPLSAYTEATVWEGDQPAEKDVIDQLGPCGP